MKTTNNLMHTVRLTILSVFLSTIATALMAGNDNDKIPGEKKGDENFIRKEVLPCLLDGTDVKTCVEQRIRYPEKAKALRIEGVVIIEFTVDTNGNVCNPRIVEDIGACCGQAAMVAVRSMKFKPAIQNGYAVPCAMRIPIRFELVS
ncbi:MAG: energy transducer TonB [Bacteroidales bacterium]|nr:energy transducer TonB [Bacteroidales bacterium]